ncbi:MAG TPA: hypothetical protein VIJ15_06030 [Dermatophilaceae bacterium]
MADIDDLLAAVAAGPQGPDVGAFFDFDGTLIHGYSAALYFRQRMASRAVGPQELIGTWLGTSPRTAPHAGTSSAP